MLFKLASKDCNNHLNAMNGSRVSETCLDEWHHQNNIHLNRKMDNVKIYNGTFPDHKYKQQGI